MSQSVEVVDPAILVRINRLYETGMSGENLYEMSRGIWKASPARLARARYCLAVYQGTVVEVYSISKWDPAGTTVYRIRELKLEDCPGRWEFTGSVAPEDVRRRYVAKSVAHYFPQGSANPVRFVGI